MPVLWAQPLPDMFEKGQLEKQSARPALNAVVPEKIDLIEWTIKYPYEAL